jgi:putative endonuclease
MTDCALEGLRLSGVVDLSSGMARTYFVYILANRSRTLYVGVTKNMARRLFQHRTSHKSFTRRYAVFRLVYAEQAPTPRDAIEREKQLKRWSRKKKLSLIEASNPDSEDLAESWFAQ